VPHIAADLMRRPKSAALGHKRPSRLRGTPSRPSLPQDPLLLCRSRVFG
jgi:hypothetical protein